MKFSANLGFLWNDRPLPDAIRAAHAHGFDAVEFHWPYDNPIAEVKAALDDTQLPLMGLNTIRGAAGENGLSALVGRTDEARAAINQALEWAGQLGAANVHVMAGFASGDKAREQFMQNLAYACEQAKGSGIGILIEPLNPHDAPNYFLANQSMARSIISDMNLDKLGVMFDCYHVARTEGDVLAEYQASRSIIGHVQFASVPLRQEPSAEDLQLLAKLDWNGPLGAEYKPAGTVEQGLGWLVRHA